VDGTGGEAEQDVLARLRATGPGGSGAHPCHALAHLRLGRAPGRIHDGVPARDVRALAREWGSKRVYLAPTQPFAWIDQPPAVNRLIGLRWLAALLKQGHKIEEFAINKLAAARKATFAKRSRRKRK